MVHDFSGVDRVYDELLRLGLRPIVELSFMPRQLACDPGQTVFSPTRGSSGPGRPPSTSTSTTSPRRPSGRCNPCLRVGGPGSAAGGWVEELLAHLDSSGAPLDFLSTPVYGNLPLDFRPALARHGLEDMPIRWTEWGTTPTHFNPVGDTVFAAAFLLRGMRSALGRAEALSHWVASDHFEELGTPPGLFHGGFGLLSVGNLRKPRFWALATLSRLGSAELEVGVRGDGAHGLIEALAARDGDGRIGVLVWNGSLDQHARRDGPLLEREVQVHIDTAPGTCYTVSHYRIDEAHSNIVSTWNELRGTAAWPDDRQWKLLEEANILGELGPRSRHPGGTLLVRDFTLPMPGVSYLELVPDHPAPDEPAAQHGRLPGPVSGVPRTNGGQDWRPRYLAQTAAGSGVRACRRLAPLPCCRGGGGGGQPGGAPNGDARIRSVVWMITATRSSNGRPDRRGLPGPPHTVRGCAPGSGRTTGRERD